MSKQEAASVKDLLTIAEAMPKEVMLRKVDTKVVSSYAQKMKDGIAFPVIVVGKFPQTEKYGTHAIVDGLHRLHAMQESGIEKCTVEVIDYKSLPDMLADMYIRNQEHGLMVSDGDRNKRIKLLRSQGMTLDKIAKAFGLHTSSIDRIVKDEQGEGKSGPKGANKSKGHKSAEAKKPKALHKMIQTLNEEFSRKRPNTIVEYCAFLTPATENDSEGELDEELFSDIETLMGWFSLIKKEVHG